MIRKTASKLPDSWQIRGFAAASLLAAAAVLAAPARAQSLDPAELEDLVAPIALYPDDVVAIILPASTFPLDIVRAARFLDDLENDPSLAPDDAWDDSIVALLNYPEVLRLMNEDLDWTWDLGEAVLTDEAAVLDAVQSFRNRAYDAGNLRSDTKQTVEETDDGIEIRPADPKVVYIPVYEPAEVIVYHSWPAYHYYPIGYPVYYYPYPAGYFFSVDFFWGVTSYFSIGWHSHFLHVRHYTEPLHPYYLNSYYLYTPYYPRNHVNITVTVDNYTDVWRPRPRRGSRPPRSITVEGRTSRVRAPRSSVTVESQPNVSSRTRTTATGSSFRAAARSSVSNDAARSDSKRSVESPAATSSQLRGVRSRETTPAARTRQQPTTRQPAAGRTRAPGSASTSTARTLGSSTARSSRSAITSEGSTRRDPMPSTRTRSRSTPSTSSGSQSSSQRSIGAVRGAAGRSSVRGAGNRTVVRGSSGSSRSAAGRQAARSRTARTRER